MPPRSFADVTALTPSGAGRFEAEADPAWTIGGKPNGGYLLAVLGRAATEVGEHDHVITASAVYLRSPEPGPVVVEAEILRAGRSAAQLRARLLQDDVTCVEALVTTGHLDPQSEPYWDAAAPVASDPDPGTSMRVPGVNPSGIPVPIMDQVDLRIDRDTAGFGAGRPTGRGELWATLELLDGTPFDPTSLLYAVDALPPATFDIQLTGWVPTFELTAYVRAVPAPGPLRVLQRAHLIDAQRVDEVCWVWDSRGRIVAQATQLAGIRLG